MKKTFSAGGVVLNRRGQVLVVNQRGNSWSLPKGHIDDGEDDLAAARREILEESGIRELRLVRDLGTYQRHRLSLDGGDDPGELKVIHLFLFTTREETLAPIDPHNPEARWVDVDEVGSLLTHPKDREFFESVAPLFRK
ncbi:MAG TPA: NUDIX domain-containing protein [Candidatus Eisenbacteria bacterium]|jgi:8-oxo-dGTP diphosphatase|nr:NUDIX domain-containing protein [Candidatus Eisenbacteria bacterium]